MLKILRSTNPGILLLCVLLLSQLTAWRPAKAGEKSPQVQIRLATDKSVYKPHDEIVFVEVIKNEGHDTIHVYDDTCFYGADMKFKSMSDGNETWELTSSASHTVKPGLRPSKRIFLAPGQVLSRMFSAYVTDDYRIAFQNHGGSAFTGFSPGIKEKPNLPDKYIGCGHIFNLGKPGLYKASIEYRNDSQWSNGDVQPKQPAWIGHVHSNEVLLELKKPESGGAK